MTSPMDLVDDQQWPIAQHLDHLRGYRRDVFLAWHQDPEGRRSHDTAFDPALRLACDPFQSGTSRAHGPVADWPRARLASDGLYHIIGTDSCQAQPRVARPGTGDVWQHRDIRVLDKHLGRTVSKAGPRRWVGPVIDAEYTPHLQRCDPRSPRWPGSVVTGSRLPIRLALVTTFGPHLMCQICGQWPATEIDHDHATGLVRGYLCSWCNHTVDPCVHLNGCPYANYLNQPPAYRLTAMRPYGRPLATPVAQGPLCPTCESLIWVAEQWHTNWLPQGPIHQPITEDMHA